MKIRVYDTIKSFTGFDEVAIQQSFRKPLSDLEGMLGVRSAYFVVLRREGMKDADAFKASMSATIGELEAMVEKEDVEGVEAEGDPKDGTPEQTNN